MVSAATFGAIIKERRARLGLTQAELGRRVGCAPITIRKIEANVLRPSVQVAQHLAIALNIPAEAHVAFVRLARADRESLPLPTPLLTRNEIGRADLSGHTIRSFELNERIGIGGFGVVYRAIQTSVAREVAIKIIHPHFADRPDFVRRFEAEAQIIAQLEHPFIIPLYDYWREPGSAYLVMRLMRGGSIRALLDTGPIEPAMVVQVMEQICSALHAAHRMGIIHRDIKPANILLDDDQNAYLADFGIAKHLGTGEPEMTHEGAIIGSPAYISPEQIRAEAVTPQTDIYSLGVMLYELLTGHQPFRAPTPVAYIQQHLNDPIPPLAQATSASMLAGLLEDVPGESAPEARNLQALPYRDLDAVIARATAKRAEDRYTDTLSMLADIRRAIGVAGDSRIAGRGAQNGTSSVTVLLDMPDMESPYKGLRAFIESDAANFFGRDMLVQDLLTRMGETGDLARFLAVVGPSGSGKSSVVRAGLIPRLRQGGLPGSEQWFITDMLPGRNPFEELEVALLRAAVNPPADLLTRLRASERGLLSAVGQILPDDPAIELVLVIDQFEELFTLVADEETRAHFLNNLVTAVLEPDSRLRIVITMRADFMDHPLRYVDLGDLMRQRAELVLPLTSDELEQAIVRPTERAGLSLERGLTEMIIRDINDQPGVLPLLQYALSELFERRQSRLLTRQAYSEMGGVLGALTRRAEQLYAGLDAAGQGVVRQLFLRLVTPGDGVEDTRRRVLRSEIAALAESVLIDGVIESFGRYRLLTFDNDPITRSPTLEVAHEAILRSWGRLHHWLDDSRADIRLQRLLATATSEWNAAGNDTSFLLSGARLDQFAAWAASDRMALTTEERSYLEASLTAREIQHSEEQARRQRELETVQKLATTETQRARESARSAQRLRWLASGLAALLIAAVGLTWFASSQRDTAQRNFQKAEQIRLAAQAQIAINNGEGGDLPALLALRSLRYGYTPEADAALLEALSRGFTKQVYVGHSDFISMVRFSADGRMILTASFDGTARLWDAQTGTEIRRFVGHTGRLNMAAFAPDGRTILTNSFDGTNRLWDLQTGKEIRRYTAETTDMFGVAFIRDGSAFVSAEGNVARLIDVESGREIRRFTGHTAQIQWVAISPNNRFLATMSRDKTARIWDLATGDLLHELIGHTLLVGGGQFSPDNNYLLTVSGDRTARLWDVATGIEIRRFTGHTAEIFDGVISPDGRYALTGSSDKTARLWDLQTGREVRQFIGHTANVGPVAFSPDGQYALTGSGDRTARLWDLELSSEPQQIDMVNGGFHTVGLYPGILSANGRYLLTSSATGTSQLIDLLQQLTIAQLSLNGEKFGKRVLSPDARFIFIAKEAGGGMLWDVATDRLFRDLAGSSTAIQQAVFSPDGRLLMTHDATGTQLWDASTGQPIKTLIDAQETVTAVAIAQDSHLGLTGSDKGIVRIWDLSSGNQLRQISASGTQINALAFSPDQRSILVADSTAVVKLWDSQDGHAIREFIGHSDKITQVGFAPDGHTAITGSDDLSARLWDIDTGQELRRFVGQRGTLLFAGFSPDGESVVTGDGANAYIWHTRLEDVTSFTCNHLLSDLNPAQKERYAISDSSAICAEFAQRDLQPTWTPSDPSLAASTPVTIVSEQAAPPASAAMEFVNELANVAMGIAVTDVFIDVGNGQVMRTRDINAETLALPVYTSSDVTFDYELPVEMGPFPMGKPLGFTLGDYLAAKGQGTYTVHGDHATLVLTFEKLVPNGVYTTWCNEFDPAHPNAGIERPCGAADGSENTFVADAQGHGQKQIDIAILPPSTPDLLQEIGIAYHSDGKNNSTVSGVHGVNVHGQLWFDFLPPEQGAAVAAPSIQMEFLNETANISMGMAVEEVFIDSGNGQVKRATELNAETLALPVYRAAAETLPDYEPPIELGPFPQGEPFGFTLGDWVKARGRGTYTVQGTRATIEVSFDNLVPNGVYTLWCAVWDGKAPNSAIEQPCGAPDGSENSFTADANGHAAVRIEIDALPPSSTNAIQEIAVAYHSDGQTHGPVVGQHGHNAHVQLWFDFLPPGFVPPNSNPSKNP